ncbi:MAG: MBL fold metallo-hydrolase [Solirubrobacteraceae bacterium]
MLETLTILGGGGWFPAHGRQTACALLRDGDSAIMIDAGTGVGRLMERPQLLAGITRLDIVLTHFHLDHIAGLAYLPAIGAIAQTIVWGPGRLLYEIPTQQILARLLHEPFHPVALEARDIEVRDLPAGEIDLPGVRVGLRHQDRHSAPTLGLRFGDALAWITDTAYDEDSARFAAGCRTLAHESWFVSAQPRNPEIHSSARQAAQVALEAEIERLLLIHLPPFRRELHELTLEAGRPGVTPLAALDGVDLSTLLV